MPIHLSIGFVVEQFPRPEYVWVCSDVNDEQEVESVMAISQTVDAVWQYEGCKCE